MLFIVPTPPITSEIGVTANQRLPMSCDVDESAGVIFAMSRTLKSSARTVTKLETRPPSSTDYPIVS
jgi:hypothetical protein